MLMAICSILSITMGKKTTTTKTTNKGNGQVWLDPRDIRFTHSRIRPVFSCGRRVLDTLEDVKAGKVNVSALPKITVIVQDDLYCSMNNRRLYVFKELRELGLLPDNKVLVRVKHASEVRAAERFTPERCSYTAKFMTKDVVTASETPKSKEDQQISVDEFQLDKDTTTDRPQTSGTPIQPS